MGTTSLNRSHIRKPDPTTMLDKARVWVAKLIAGPFWTDPRRKNTRPIFSATPEATLALLRGETPLFDPMTQED